MSTSSSNKTMLDLLPTDLGRNQSTFKPPKKEKLVSHHDNQLNACKALPTLGRNQSMFDENNFSNMQELKMSNTSTAPTASALSLLEEGDEEEEDDDYYNEDGGQDDSHRSAVSDFVHARAETFTKNIATIDTIATGGLTTWRKNMGTIASMFAFKKEDAKESPSQKRQGSVNPQDQ